MSHLVFRRAARRLSALTPLLVILTLLLVFAAGAAFATSVGDQVAFQARNRSGVPLH
jgi:hypothetical protein